MFRFLQPAFARLTSRTPAPMEPGSPIRTFADIAADALTLSRNDEALADCVDIAMTTLDPDGAGETALTPPANATRKSTPSVADPPRPASDGPFDPTPPSPLPDPVTPVHEPDEVTGVLQEAALSVPDAQFDESDQVLDVPQTTLPSVPDPQPGEPDQLSDATHGHPFSVPTTPPCKPSTPELRPRKGASRRSTVPTRPKRPGPTSGQLPVVPRLRRRQGPGKTGQTSIRKPIAAGGRLDATTPVLVPRPSWLTFTAGRALREIRRYQLQTDLLLPPAPFRRLVREISHEYRPETRWQSAAIEALQEAIESSMVSMFECTSPPRAASNAQP